MKPDTATAGPLTTRTSGQLIKERIIRALYRFVKDGDENLSDREFVQALFERHRRYLAEEIVDVNE